MRANEPSFTGPKLCPKCRTRFDDDPGRCPHDGRRLVDDLTGRVIGGRYTLKELLGVGGMDSSVWLAIQANIDRAVAIKLLPQTTQEASERFARGARIASKLNHPHITVVHDYGRTDDGHLFLVMELLEEGHTLQAVVKQGPVPVDRAVHIVDQVLKALDHAHKRQVVHRDIKPANLFLTRRNEDVDFVKVLDFGIARWVDDPQGLDAEPHEEITTARQVCGTPQYMAPEQVASGPVDQRTDLYALGVVFYRLLTGRLPFTERDHTALFMHHLHTAPPPFSEVRPELDSPELEEVVMRALAKHPDQRFASAAEMRRALRQVRRRMGLLPADLEDSISYSSRSNAAIGSLSMTTTSFTQDGRKWLPLILLLLLAAAVSLMLFLLRDPPQERAPSVFPDAAVASGGAAPATTPATAPPTTPASVAPASAAPSAPASVAQAPEPTPDAGKAAPPAQRQVMVDSVPTGATVREGGETLGETPIELELNPGLHRLTFSRRGYETYVLTLDLAESGEAIRRTVELVRRRRRPDRRQPATDAAPATEAPVIAAPASKAPTSKAPASKAPASKAGKKVRVRLLDEDRARTFEVGGQAPKRPASTVSDKPKIKIIE